MTPFSAVTNYQECACATSPRVGRHQDTDDSIERCHVLSAVCMRDFFTGESSPGMIDWTTMPTYNTIMSLAAGAGLLALVLFVRDLLRPHAEDPVSTDGWALTFGSLGVILTLTGLHMSLTWPL